MKKKKTKKKISTRREKEKKKDEAQVSATCFFSFFLSGQHAGGDSPHVSHTHTHTHTYIPPISALLFLLNKRSNATKTEVYILRQKKKNGFHFTARNLSAFAHERLHAPQPYREDARSKTSVADCGSFGILKSPVSRRMCLKMPYV